MSKKDDIQLAFRAVSLHKNGTPAHEVAKQLKVETHQVMNWVLMADGIAPKEHKVDLSEADQECIRLLYKSGMTLEQLKKDFAITDKDLEVILGDAVISVDKVARGRRDGWVTAAELAAGATASYLKKKQEEKKKKPRKTYLRASDISDLDKKKMAKLYIDEELQFQEIGDRYATSPTTVRKILVNQGVTIRKGPALLMKHGGKDSQKAKRMLTYGHSAKEIAKALNFSTATVERWMKCQKIGEGTPLPKPPSLDLEKKKQQAKVLYGQGRNVDEIAFFLNDYKENIIDWLSDFDMHIRREDRNKVLAQSRTKSRFQFLADKGGDPEYLSKLLEVPVPVIKKWTEEYKSSDSEDTQRVQ